MHSVASRLNDFTLREMLRRVYPILAKQSRRSQFLGGWGPIRPNAASARTAQVASSFPHPSPEAKDGALGRNVGDGGEKGFSHQLYFNGNWCHQGFTNLTSRIRRAWG
jgi:hypothetical protein